MWLAPLYMCHLRIGPIQPGQIRREKSARLWEIGPAGECKVKYASVQLIKISIVLETILFKLDWPLAGVVIIMHQTCLNTPLTAEE